MKEFTEEFDETINVVFKDASNKKSAEIFSKLAKKYQLDFVMVKSIPKNSEKELMPYDIFIFLSNSAWFQKEFPQINYNTNNQDLNKFGSASKINVLTRRKIRYLPFEQIPKQYLTGDYQIHGEKNNIDHFLEDLNLQKNQFDAVKDLNYQAASEIDVSYIYICYMLIFILCMAFVFCLLIYIGQLSKELSIAALFGYSKIKYALEKTFKLIFIPVVISLLFINVFIVNLIGWSSLQILISSGWPIFKIYGGVIFLQSSLIFVFLLFMMNKRKIINQMKGEKKSYQKLIISIKVIIVSLVSYLLVITLISTNDYLNTVPYLKIWENSTHYGNIAITAPATFSEDYKKDDALVVPVVEHLWDLLDEQGAMLFMPAFSEKEGSYFDIEYANTLPLKGKYAFINSNYLNKNIILDNHEKTIKIDKIPENTWIIYVPEGVPLTSADIKEFRKVHQWETNKKEKDLVEHYIRIKKDQMLFSFDSQAKLDKPMTTNYAFVLVDGNKLSSHRSIKMASLTNGYLHPYIKNPKRPLDTLGSIIKKSGAEPYLLYISTVYDEIYSKVESYRLTALVNFIAMLLSFLILGTLFKIDRETYYYHEGQRIDVSQLMGYRFLDIHRKKIFLNIGIYILCFLGFFILSVGSIFLKSDGVFVPRDGWTNEWILFSFIFISVVLIISFIIDALLLRRNDKQIAIRLKEGIY